MKKILAMLIVLLFVPLNVASQDFCEGNFDYDDDQDGTDAFTFKTDFGRSLLKNPCPPDGPAPVPRTGQTTDYILGDDGYFQKGVAWPNPRFTDNGDGTVTDNLTGLIWLANANCFGGRHWDEAIGDCNGLSAGYCGLIDGSNAGDWRLPSCLELQSLLNLKFYEPALSNSAGTGQWTHGDPFINLLTDDFYWTSTTVAVDTQDAWNIGTYNGIVVFADKAQYFHHVWCVRGGH